jgi:D-alanyl-D-alanine carboxypeptidase
MPSGGLRVIDLDTAEELINLKPRREFFVGSVRKIFTVGELLNQVGPAHTYNTPVYRHGALDSAGLLHGDLILVHSATRRWAAGKVQTGRLRSLILITTRRILR